MGLRFCGYFPKRKTLLPSGYDLPGVVEIASVSDCIAHGPEDWITAWQHNELGFFHDPRVAESLVPQAEQSRFDLFGYAFTNERFVDGRAEAWDLPDLACTPPGNGFEALGFDVVSRSISTFFECSPLSCNGGAQTFRANAYCLFDALEAAIAAAKSFSSGGWEPGPYYIARVLRRRRPPGTRPVDAEPEDSTIRRLW